MSMQTWIAAAVFLGLAVPGRTQPVARPDLPPRATRPIPSQPPLPPLPADAQRLIDQWKQDQTSIIEQLRFLQRAYRDDGHAEDAAAVAAQVRGLQQRPAPVLGIATADLVNEGLPTRDEPVLMSAFRHRAGETLSFAIRGRDDQQVWGATTYTDASALETAAVHAGLLRPGQIGIVRVRVLPGQDSYDAASQNGVQSQAYGRYAGSYRFAAVSITATPRTASLSSYRDLVGHAITIPVVGAASGNVWGTDIYTDDSSPGAAAVHAGVLSPGEFGFVTISLMPGQARYDGSARNGVTSQSYGGFEGSFRVERSSEPPIVQLPGGEDASRLVPLVTLRGRTGLSIVMQVVGSLTGGVWGTGVYTDDSSIAAAAVHAGLLEPGELGFLRVTIGSGRTSFAASDSHGIRSQPYGPWDGSFRLERVAKP
jgi:LCCL domain